MKNSVTSNLREVLKELGIIKKNGFVFSDSRKDKRAVGVKFLSLFIEDSKKELVREKMEERGFIYCYIRDNNRGHYGGTRFTFYKKGN